MKIRRIFAGSIVALLLCLSPLAAACDLSCAFASMNSDCHFQEAETPDSANGGMKMDGMAMDAMAMPGMNYNQDQQTGSAISGARANHPSISDMGPCEKQSCDGDSAVSTKANGSSAHRHELVLALIEIPHADGAPPIFHDVGEDIAIRAFQDGRPLLITLRI
jgi:hypothetical protein